MIGAQFVLSVLPASDGWLPYWHLVVAAAAVFNAVQCYSTLKLTRRLYAGSPHLVNPLQSHTFGTWTLLSAVVRGYAAYHIHEKSIYDVCIFTYFIAFGHFTSELLIFKNCKLNVPLLSPLAVSTLSLVWMLVQYDFYVSKT